MSSTPHPYYPLGSELTGYVANKWGAGPIFCAFGASVATLIMATRIFTKRFTPNLRSRDHALVLWLVLSGAIHLLIEGYFSYNHRRMPAMQDWLGQGWKEYAHSDSRYMTAEPFVVCMESVTAFVWGPLCLLTAWMVLSDSSWRHPLQLLVAGGQFYGVFLYYATNLMEYYYSGVSYARPGALYYWGYFVGMNGFWFTVPAYCVWSSVREIGHAFARLKQFEEPKKS